MRRRLGLALAGGIVATVGIAGPASALLVWTLVGTPLAATAGSTTSFTLTATNLDLVGELGCLEVILPPGWSGVSAGSAVPSTGRGDWVTNASGNTVVAHSTSGGGRLETGHWVTFTINARPSIAGISTWANHAHQRQDCTGGEEAGLPIAVTVLPQLLPTPTPLPTSTSAPTPQPTPKATPGPTPTAAPTPRSTASPRPTPRATATPRTPESGDSPRPTATPDAPAAATPSATPDPGDGAATASPDDSGATPGGAKSPSPSLAVSEVGLVGYDTGEVELALGPLGVAGGVDTWIVPAATMGVPGVLILLWIGLQAVGAFAWVPAVRRLRDDDDEVPSRA